VIFKKKIPPILVFSITKISNEEVDKTISIYQNFKPETAHTFRLLASLFNEKKGDYPSAIHYYQQALQIEEEVC
jgi:tetratricopeptide (TPR) repeat protein